MVTIFDDGVDPAEDVLADRVVLQTQQLPRRANPQRAIRSTQERVHRRTEWRLLPWRCPRREPHAVVLDEARSRADPDVAIGGLRDGVGCGCERPVLDSPCGVAVLREA